MHVQIAWQTYHHQQRMKVSHSHESRWPDPQVHVHVRPSGVCCVPLAWALGWVVRGQSWGGDRTRSLPTVGGGHHVTQGDPGWGLGGAGPVGRVVVGTCAGPTNARPVLPHSLGPCREPELSALNRGWKCSGRGAFVGDRQ